MPRRGKPENLKRGGSPGRPKGVPNKITQEVKDIAKRLVEDVEYQEALGDRLKQGSAGAIEVTLWHYAYGKPKETHELTGKDGGPIEMQHDYRTELARRLVSRTQRGGDSGGSGEAES